VEKFAVLEVSKENKDNSGLKNEFILKTKEEFLLILNKDKFTKKQAMDILEKEKWLDYGEVIAICAGVSQDAVRLSIEDVLDCFALEMVGLLFRRDILTKTGSYNVKLEAMTEFEFLCRLTEANGNCLLVFPGIEEDEWTVTETDMFSCAYLVRRYLKALYSWGKSESILQQMCFVAEQSCLRSVFYNYLNEMITSETAYNRIAADTAPILIFRGDATCYGVLQDFADSLAYCLRQRGEAVILAEAGNTDYEYLQSHACKAIIGFQAGALRSKFFKDLQGPKLQFWLDNPVFYAEQFAALPKDCFILCHDANYVNFIKKHYHKENVQIMPPAGHAQFIYEEKERPYDIVFVGKYFPEPDVQLDGIYKLYYEFMLQHPEMTFSAGLEALLTEIGRTELIEHILDIFRDLNPLCQRIINHYKKRVIETILEAGYEIHVYGDSWDAYESPNAHRLIKHPAVSVDDSLKEWQKAKIGLNIMSWHKAGMTERVANIMLSGAVCLSDETIYLNDNFTDGEQLVCYCLNRLDELPGKIERLLIDDEWAKIARRGYDIAMKEHTWEQRTGQLVEMVEGIWDRDEESSLVKK